MTSDRLSTCGFYLFLLFQLLLEHGASLFAENVDKETPCDRAEKQKLFELAQYLESKMVFCVSMSVIVTSKRPIEGTKTYYPPLDDHEG